MGCQLVLITNRKSHTGFRLILTSMTLNDLKRRIAFILRFSPNSIAFLANYVTVVKYRPIISAKYCLRFPVFHFWPKLTHPAARSLCNSWATYLSFQQLHRCSQDFRCWVQLLPLRGCKWEKRKKPLSLPSSLLLPGDLILVVTTGAVLCRQNTASEQRPAQYGRR